MKVIKKEHNGRQFELRVSFEWGYVWVAIYEIIRPTWKIFRTRYIGRCGNNLENFNTVDEAIENAFDAVMKKLQTEEEVANKIKEFEKKY